MIDDPIGNAAWGPRLPKEGDRVRIKERFVLFKGNPDDLGHAPETWVEPGVYRVRGEDKPLNNGFVLRHVLISGYHNGTHAVEFDAAHFEQYMEIVE